jgi:hypothetical protein
MNAIDVGRHPATTPNATGTIQQKRVISMGDPMPSTLPVLDRSTPGASLHPLLQGKAVGIARVKYPHGARFDDNPNPEILRRISAGLHRLNARRP